MSVETSNAPREVWAVLRGDGWPVSVDSDREVAERRASEWNAKRLGAAPRSVAPFVRRDLVVPTVNELSRKVRELGWTMSAPDSLRMAHALRPWLLSRIEGGNEAEPAREYRCRASCRGSETRANGEVVTVVEEVDDEADGISLPHETREPAERTKQAVERNGWAEDVWIESRVVGPWVRDDEPSGGVDHAA